jgi:hypothetical protein
MVRVACAALALFGCHGQTVLPGNALPLAGT